MKKTVLFASGLFITLLASAAPPAGGFSFDQILQRSDTNKDGVISRDEFRGPTQLFARLDKDQDGELTREEFEKSRSGQTGNRRSTGRAPDGVRVLKDIEYAFEDNQSLQLDLYLPEKAETPVPLIVWIHGGGWRNGDKANVNRAVLKLSESGYAVASINYRLKDLSIHPKNIHDCKGAVRWLRAHAEQYGFDPQRVAVGGGSAGGHLSLLLGMSSDIADLEGTVGGNTEQAGPVQAIVDLYGPADLPLMAENSQRFNKVHSITDEQLIHASPLTYLTPDDPPVLILQGDQDNTVPMNQSVTLNKRYQKAGLESELHIIPGAGHGGPVFSDENSFQLIKTFLDKHLKAE